MNKKLLINLPKQYEQRFGELGDEGKRWLGKIIQFIENTQNYISQSPFFFPEYTKHSVEHINNVLEISRKLIPNETLQKLNADAIALLIMGIISHDIGMFIKPDGLVQLLMKKSKSGSGEIEISWRSAWEKYQTQLKHYSLNEIKKYFGDPSNFIINDGLDIMQLPNVITVGTLLPWRIRLCGEFLRKWHPRLAQEIIEDNFPGNQQVDLFSNIEMDNEYRKLIGIIARSHGMNITDLDSNLKMFDEDALEYPCEVPIYYLMAILRLADYFDAGNDRAPHAIMAMQHFESEASYDEFKWNQTVNLGNDWGEEKYERIFVKIKLNNIDSRTFLKVEGWLKGVQRELDECWRQISLNYKNKYQFSIRRIDSNIFQNASRKSIEKQIVIEKAQLQAAPEILELLVAPLYGGNVTYGVRELLQNAIDTCREREVIENIRGNKSYKGIVWIEVNSVCEQPYFSITDNGCGMDKEVILKYFLMAGSSYRNSIQWKEQFENQLVNRSGKFGIGLLAAFLLGNRIEVETKSLDEKESYLFEVNNQNYEQINISRSEDIKKKSIAQNSGGTCIQIDIKRNTADDMIKEFREGKTSYIGVTTEWAQWFWLSKPIVKYIINGKEYDNPYGHVAKKGLYGLQENGRWFQLEERGEFDSIWWTPEENYKVWCNGIFVTDKYENGIASHYGKLVYGNDRHDLCLRTPSISIVDSKNVLDLNLSRDTVQNFPKDIKRSLYIENCKLALSVLMLIDFTQQNEIKPEFPFAIKQDSENMHYLLFSKNGYNLPMGRVLKEIMGKMIWLLYKDGRWDEMPFDKLDGIVCLLHYGDHINYENDIYDGLFNAFMMGLGNNMRFESIQIKKNYCNNFADMTPSEKINGKRAFSKKIEEMANEFYDDLIYDDFKEVYDFELDKFFPYVEEIKSINENFFAASRKKENINNSMLSDLRKYFDVACGYQVINDVKEEDLIVNDLFNEYFGNKIWIPYDIEQRKKMFPKFFDPQNDIYKYIRMVGKQKGFYNINLYNEDI